MHRIGRTGRCGKTGLTTTFINKNCPESILLDLKHLLREAKQKIPPVLAQLNDPEEISLSIDGERGCPICGGLGHRVVDCPKQSLARKQRVGEITGRGSKTGSDW